MGSGAKKHVEYFSLTPASALAEAHEIAAATDVEGSGPGEGDSPTVGTITEPRADVVTPIPEALTVGDPVGEPLLVGGADLEDSLATLVAYDSTDGPIEVLHARVTPQAQAKLLEALALSEEQLIPVAVDKQVTGRLPIDEEHQLYEQLETVVKSVNYHLKAGDGIPAHTRDNFQQLADQLAALDGQVTDAEQAMVDDYRAGLEDIAARLDPDFDVPYEQGGKVGFLAAHELATTVTVTEHVPAPAGEVPEGLLAATARTATRLQPTLEHGTVRWDGTTRSETSGIEYATDLGEGFEAVYRPHPDAGLEASDKPVAGQRGHLEVIAPPGGGNASELVRRLGQLNLVNRPMNHAEAEWAYLTRNIWAQRLDDNAQVKTALASARSLPDTVTELVFAERADQAIGLKQDELAAFAREIRLEAEARALPHQVARVREAVAAATGFADGESLASSAGYEPTPRRSGGWFVFDRWDVAGDPQACADQFSGKALVHHVTGNNPAQMIQNGAVLACTERRRTMGLPTGLGMSESTDTTTGGSQAVDLRVKKAVSSSGCRLIWENPARLLRRADWYAYPTDHFGAAVAEGGKTTAGQTRDPATVAGFAGGSNEVLFKNGIELVGPEGPDRIVCANKAQRTKVLAALAARGITHLHDVPIEEAVQ